MLEESRYNPAEFSPELKFVFKQVFQFMEKSIEFGFFSKRKLTIETPWNSDETINVFNEILLIRINGNPIVSDFTLIGNHKVSFTITEQFYEYYLTGL